MSKNNTVDFNNPEALEAELAAAEAATTPAAGETKAPKEKKPKVIKVSFTADRDIKAGETIEFEYQLPAAARRGGVNAGISVEEMTAEQLKIEYRNANSVLYKTGKAGRDTTQAQARLDKVVEAMKAKGIQPGQRAAAPVKVDAAVIAQLIAKGEVKIEDIQSMLDATAGSSDATETESAQ